MKAFIVDRYKGNAYGSAKCRNRSFGTMMSWSRSTPLA